MQLPDDIVDLDPMVANPNILLFSKPKAGKTTWACTDDNTLLINCEVGGDISAANSPILGSNVKQWKVKRYEDWVRCLEWLKECIRQEGSVPFKWVVVDTISTLQDRHMMRYCLDKMLIKKPERNKYIPDKPEYLETQQMIVQDIKELCDMPFNLIILAHVMQQTDPEGNDFYYPKIQGGKIVTAQAILAMVTSYGYMYMKERKDPKDKSKALVINGRKVIDRWIMWEDSGHMQGGDRTGVLGPYTKNLTVKQLSDRLQKKAEQVLKEREARNANN